MMKEASQASWLHLLTGVLMAATFNMAWIGQAEARDVVSREAPSFPSDALDEGIYEGKVKARLNIAADGSVKSVDIVEAEPKRVFDKAARRALMRWKYAPGGEESLEVQLTFKE
jgi:protein TonB